MQKFASRKRTLDEHSKTQNLSQNTTLNKRDNKHSKKRESKYVTMLLKIGYTTYWNSQDSQVFIIPAKWLTRWKNYINSDSDLTQNKTELQKDIKISQNDILPGPISCKELIADNKDFLHNLANPSSESNFVLRENLQSEKDFHIISKELMNFLQKQYGGSGILRHHIPIGPSAIKKLDLKLSKVFLYFI